MAMQHRDDRVCLSGRVFARIFQETIAIIFTQFFMCTLPNDGVAKLYVSLLPVAR